MTTITAEKPAAAVPQRACKICEALFDPDPRLGARKTICPVCIDFKVHHKYYSQPPNICPCPNCQADPCRERAIARSFEYTNSVAVSEKLGYCIPRSRYPEGYPPGFHNGNAAIIEYADSGRVDWHDLWDDCYDKQRFRDMHYLNVK